MHFMFELCHGNDIRYMHSTHHLQFDAESKHLIYQYHSYLLSSHSTRFVKYGVTMSWVVVLYVSFLMTCVTGISGNMRFAKSFWFGAQRQAIFEQKIEDSNTIERTSNNLLQRLIVLPLDDSFIPSKYNSLYGKVQYSDKCCFPKSIGSELLGKPYDFPWIFELTPAQRKVQNIKQNASSSSPVVSKDSILGGINKAYVSTLDFRAPENYIFVPQWVMETLRLQKYDLVDVKFIRMKLASLVTLQPISENWLTFVEKQGSKVATILENEMNKYATLTVGSIVAIQHENVDYALKVKDTRTEEGISTWGVRIQDADVKLEIDTSPLLRSEVDTMKS